MAGPVLGADYPETTITNGVLEARFLLPDAQNGYYRGTRFDWSGAISSLQYKGHDYFGKWFERYDPKGHDAIMGPVEEYRTNEAGLGYDEARTGETFVRIGVGVVRKPEEKSYRVFNTYEIVDNGKWTITPGPGEIRFVHELNAPNGYAYVYTKNVRLVKGQPQMAIEHELKNTGSRAIETAQYNHNFFMIDALPLGPDTSLKLPFALKTTRDLRGLLEVRDRELAYIKELQPRQSVITEIEGFGPTAADYDIRIENRKAGAGVRLRGDRPLQKLVFWSIRSTGCPEPYIDLRVEPGNTIRWTYTYDFYTLPGGAND
jgi:hypothetical protein